MKQDIPEQWRQFRDTSYYVSDQGRVKHIFKNGNVRFLQGMRHVSKTGNKQIAIKINKRYFYVKDMVWECFRGKKTKGLYLCHKNMLWKDNSLYNLQLLTTQEVGLAYGGKTKTGRYVINLDTGKVSYGTRQAGKDNYCSYQTITDICNGIRKRHCVNVAWYDKDKERAYRGKYRYEEEL